MSGGVDSSVCALLMKQAGFTPTGVTCKMFGDNVFRLYNDMKTCADNTDMQEAFLEAVDDAKQVCRKLGIPHYTFNCKEPFERHVISPFVESYLLGQTPNPCVNCNRHVKFDELHRRRLELGIDYLATGHYARIMQDEKTGRWKLLRGINAAKDQSYMLYILTQEQLSHTLFPLGEMTKEEVRDAARQAGFTNAQNPESQDVCFIPDGNYLQFVRKWADLNETSPRNSPRCASVCQNTRCEESSNCTTLCPGDICDADGRVLGHHDGIAGYTIGQRKGIGIAAPEPLYVIEKDVLTNTLIVGPKSALMKRDVTATNVNFVSISKDDALNSGEFRVVVKTSYRQTPQKATARVFYEKNSLELQVTFDEPLIRPAAGQALVLYGGEDNNEVLCGGIIC